MFELMLTFLKIGLLSFGGGWSIVGIINSEITSRGWISEERFIEMISLAQITPGPVALNMATFTGFELYGLPGAIAATSAVVAAPLSILIAVTLVIKKTFVTSMFPILRPLATTLLFVTLWHLFKPLIGGDLRFLLYSFLGYFFSLKGLSVHITFLICGSTELLLFLLTKNL